jgi:hypothetical protein
MDERTNQQMFEENQRMLRENQKMMEEMHRELKYLRRAQARIKRRTTFLLTIIAMLVLITSTLAWFTLSNFSSVNDMNIKISTAPQLYLDIENRGTSDLSLWKKTLTNEMINTYLSSVNAPAINDQLLDPVTTSNGIAFTNRTGATRNANSTSYIEFKVWFLATREMYVHLSGQTVEVNGANATTSVTTTETGAKADVVNALRVSFEDNGTAAIYEPNKGSAVAGQSTFDVGTSFANDTRIFHLNELEPKQITIRVWIEGEDPECDNDIQAANVELQMLFGGSDENNASFE